MIAIALIGVLTVCACFILYSHYPGVMGVDALRQFEEVKSGRFTDWHPPVMAWVWRYLAGVVPGSGMVFVVHVALYWAGFALLALTLLRNGRTIAAGLIAAIALNPACIMLTWEISKDVGMACCLLTAAALIYLDRKDQFFKLGLRIPIVILLTYATLVRTNAVFATAPMIVYWLYGGKRRGVLTLALAGVLALALIPASSFVNSRIFDAEKSDAFVSLQLFDTAGIAVRSGDISVFPAASNEVARLRKCYTPVLWDPLGGKACDYVRSNGPSNTRTWIGALLKHPAAYMSHRSDYMAHALRTYYLRHHPADEKFQWNYHLNIEPSGLKERAISVLLGLSILTPLFSLTVGLLAVGLITGLRLRAVEEGRFAACLCASGLFYLGAYAVIGVASEYRYFLWSMIALPIALVFACEASAKLLPAKSVKRLWISLAGALAAIAVLLQLVQGPMTWDPAKPVMTDRRTWQPIPPEAINRSP